MPSIRSKSSSAGHSRAPEEILNNTEFNEKPFEFLTRVPGALDTADTKGLRARQEVTYLILKPGVVRAVEWRALVILPRYTLSWSQPTRFASAFVRAQHGLGSPNRTRGLGNC